MRQRQNEMARAELTTKAHRASPPPKAITEFDRQRLADAQAKRERKAAKLRDAT